MNKYDFNYIASDYFGYVLGSLSTICLILSLILFLAAGKNFFRIEANVVYFNCCLAMFIAMTLYLFTSRTFAFNRYLCMATAFLLHYTWLALFSWMLCIGLLILYSVTIGKYILCWIHYYSGSTSTYKGKDINCIRYGYFWGFWSWKSSEIWQFQDKFGWISG